MKIIFIEPRPPEPHVYSKFKIPRLGCVILGTILRNAGHEVTIFVEEVADIDWTTAHEADVVAISATTSTVPRSYELADMFKREGKTVIMGGSHVTFCAEEALEHCDYVVKKEGEVIINELIDAIGRNAVPEHLDNIAFKKNGTIVDNPIHAFITDLDSLPIPDFTLIHGWKNDCTVASIETSRGCPFNCAFCSVILMFGRKLRFKSVDRIVEEVKYYLDKVKPRHIFFCDDNFSANPRRTKELLRRFIEEGIELDWSAQVRVELANDPELLELMRKTNCYAVYVGFESVNPKTLEAYNKSQSVEQIQKAIQAFHEHDIHIHGMFVFGSDEDTVESLFENLQFARRMKIDSIQFLILTPLPGTRVYNDLYESGRIFNHDWSYYDGHNVVYEPAQMTAYELQVETMRAMYKFYTLTSVFRYLARLDKWYAFVRLYGKYMTARALHLKKPYTHELRKRVAERLPAISEGGKSPSLPIKIGIPSISVDLRHREFFGNFFKQLGVGVIFSQDKETPEKDIKTSDDNLMDMLQRQIKIIQQKADVVVVPVVRKVNTRLAELVRSKKQQLASINPRLLLLEADMDALYKSCVEVGLAMGKNLAEIRKAYFRALQQTHLRSAPIQ